jgi:hypothetical protein
MEEANIESVCILKLLVISYLSSKLPAPLTNMFYPVFFLTYIMFLGLTIDILMFFNKSYLILLISCHYLFTITLLTIGNKLNINEVFDKLFSVKQFILESFNELMNTKIFKNTSGKNYLFVCGYPLPSISDIKFRELILSLIHI